MALLMTCLVDLLAAAAFLLQRLRVALGSAFVAYRVPTFNLTCNIGPSANGPFAWPCLPFVGAPRVGAQPCALVYGKRVNSGSGAVSDFEGFPGFGMSLLLPHHTDIRSFQDPAMTPDTVEVPAGSGRWYGVGWVDDIGKGYPNEHRTAVLVAILGSWPVPYP